MTAYIVRRVGVGIGLLFLLSVIVFFLFSILPADPARLTCGKICTPAILETNRARLGLDKPVVEQYVIFVTGIFAGRVFGPDSPDPVVCNAPCLGYSFTQHEEVTSLIARALPVTMALAIGAFVIWMVVGILLGIYAALRRGRWQDRTVLGRLDGRLLAARRSSSGSSSSSSSSSRCIGSRSRTGSRRSRTPWGSSRRCSCRGSSWRS